MLDGVISDGEPKQADLTKSEEYTLGDNETRLIPTPLAFLHPLSQLLPCDTPQQNKS